MHYLQGYKKEGEMINAKTKWWTQAWGNSLSILEGYKGEDEKILVKDKWRTQICDNVLSVLGEYEEEDERQEKYKNTGMG